MSMELPTGGRFEHDPLPTARLRIKAHELLPVEVMEGMVLDRYPDLRSRMTEVRTRTMLYLDIASVKSIQPQDFLFMYEKRERLIAAIAGSLGEHR